MQPGPKIALAMTLCLAGIAALGTIQAHQWHQRQEAAAQALQAEHADTEASMRAIGKAAAAAEAAKPKPSPRPVSPQELEAKRLEDADRAWLNAHPPTQR